MPVQSAKPRSVSISSMDGRGDDTAQGQREGGGEPDRAEVDPAIGRSAKQRAENHRSPQQKVREPGEARAAAERGADELAGLHQRAGHIGKAKPAAAPDLKHGVFKS